MGRAAKPNERERMSQSVLWSDTIIRRWKLGAGSKEQGARSKEQGVGSGSHTTGPWTMGQRDDAKAAEFDISA